MKVLLSYASEFDKGEGIHFARVLRRLGHDVHELNVAASAAGTGSPGRVVRGYPPDLDIQTLVEAAGGADLFLYIEPAGLIPLGLHHSPIPTACVLSDVHRNPASRRLIARLFDHVFVYPPNYVSAFTDHDHRNVHWLPYACDTAVFHDRRLPRDLDVAFVGRLYTPERRRVVSLLAQHARLNEQRYYLQEEIPDIYSRARIVVDLPVADDIPFRVFEAMSCRAMLLTRRVESGLDRLFTEGVHFATFDGDRDLLDKVRHFLAHDDERARIATAAWEEVRRRHTLEHRVTALLDAVQRGPAAGAPVRRVSADVVSRTYTRILERDGRVETLLKLAATAGAGAASRWRFQTAAFRCCMRRVLLGW